MYLYIYIYIYINTCCGLLTSSLSKVSRRFCNLYFSFSNSSILCFANSSLIDLRIFLFSFSISLQDMIYIYIYIRVRQVIRYDDYIVRTYCEISIRICECMHISHMHIYTYINIYIYMYIHIYIYI
jgi:hypothetical protein